MLNIVVPMAGRGERFKNKGYDFPKPLIEVVEKKPMIQIAVENIAPAYEHRFIFICLREHYEKYALKDLFKLITSDHEVVVIDKPTRGQACSVLLAKEFIDNDEDDLLTANCDQFIDANIEDFITFSRKGNMHGSIITFKGTHFKWSFVKKDENGFVIEAAEKRPISNDATTGLYYFRKGKYFTEGIQRQIEKDVSINGEFYICPVYNEMILKDMKIVTYEIPADKMYGLGTPEDLKNFQKNYERKGIANI